MRAALLCVVILFSASGCGSTAAEAGSGSDGGQKTQQEVTAEKFIDQFRSAVGSSVIVHDEVLPVLGPMTVIELPESGPGRAALEAKYGNFRVSVYADLNAERRAFLTHGAAPDADGTYWEYRPPEYIDEKPYWYARRFYGNVHVVWGSSVGRGGDERWLALTAILSRLL